MPWGSVRVLGPEGREVYVNGNYEEVAGDTNDILAVEYGDNTFESLDELFRIDLRARAEVNDDHPHVEAELVPVEPPEPTALTPPAGGEEDGGS